MKDYIPLNNKAPSKIKIFTKLLTGILIVFLGIRVHSLMSVIAGNLFMVGGLLRKRVCVNRAGLITVYDAFFFNYEEVWSFEEMTSIHRDCKHCGADEVMLHFGKGAVVRQHTFKREIAKAILMMALERNTGLIIGDI